MILSIGMIVKNEEHRLRRCLEAMTPVLQQVDCELIIADTGSTDNTVRIANEFTDSVFFFEWCNDFSAARNAVLMKARGEWFMTLDADEIFVDTSDLIAFFNTGEYRKYNTGTFIQRSSNDKAMKEVSDLRVLRMTKIFDETRYVGAIHEAIIPAKTPTKHLRAVALHYGYLKEDNTKEVERKIQNYLSIHYAEIEKDPSNSKLYYDLCNTYIFAEDFTNAIEACEQGLKCAIAANSPIRFPLWLNKAYLCHLTQKNDAALYTIREYFHSKNNPSVFDLDMHYLAGHIYNALQQSPDAIRSFEDYIKALKQFKNGAFNDTEITVYIERYTNEAAYRTAELLIIRNLALLGDYVTAGNYLRTRVRAKWYQNIESAELLIDLEMLVMKDLGDFNRLMELYQLMKGDVQCTIKSRIEKELHLDGFCQPLLSALAALNDNSVYIRLIRLRHAYFQNNLTIDKVEEFITQVDDWSPMYADVLYFAVRYGCGPGLLSDRLDFLDMEPHILNEYLHFADMPSCVVQYCRTHTEKTPKGHLWRAMLCHLALRAEQLSDSEIIELFSEYAASAHAYTSKAFAQELSCEQNIPQIPVPLRVGCYYHLAVHAQELRQKVAYFRAAVKLYPEIANAAKVFLHEIQGKIGATPQQTEMEKYAAIIKENIMRMIQQEDFNGAKELINSYEQLCPNDADLPEIKKRIL